MDVQLVEKHKDRLTLRVSGVSPAYMNALRRALMTEVPVLAIEDVEFRKNSSALYDEIVAHRLGLLSIKTDLETYTLPKDCKCGGVGCAQCQVKLVLKAVGPKTVYAEELKSQDPKAVPMHGKTPIVKLLEGQEIELEATAVLGRGMDHSKWNACLAHYKEYPFLTIGKQPQNAKQLAEKYPELLDLKGGVLSIKEKNIPLYDVHEAIVAESGGAITVAYKDDYLLYVESWQQLVPKQILAEAINVLDAQLDEFKGLVKEV